jgi:hypothetical protein
MLPECRLDRLLLLILGWFLASSTAVERTSPSARPQVHGLSVGEVMSREPVVAPGWWTVQAFADFC